MCLEGVWNLSVVPWCILSQPVSTTEGHHQEWSLWQNIYTVPEGQTDGPTNEQMDGPTNGQMDRPTNGRRNPVIDRMHLKTRSLVKFHAKSVDGIGEVTVQYQSLDAWRFLASSHKGNCGSSSIVFEAPCALL